MITFNNLKKSYSRNVVLEINSLDIPKGQAFGLVGNNGAGKTTLFSLLLDLIKPTKGKVINNNIDVKESEDWKSFTSAFLDESFLISYLLPEEYFYFIGDLRGVFLISLKTCLMVKFWVEKNIYEIFQKEIKKKLELLPH
jgi:ABC-2 type transport system ATP-binding protein